MTIFRRSLLSAGAVMAMAGAVAIISPAQAQEATAPMPKHHHGMMKAGPQDASQVEARITKLHDQLKITAAQEDAFGALAKVMRDNRDSQEALIADKKKAEQTQTALDDLQAYAQIAQAHAEGAKNLADAFGNLYSQLSDDQKKAADEAFRRHKQRVMQHMLTNAAHKPNAAATPTTPAPAAEKQAQ